LSELISCNYIKDERKGMRLHENVHLEYESSGEACHFIGYYDKSPFDSNDTRLIAHRVRSADDRLVEAGDTTDVGVFDIETGEFVQHGETQAFNWQQGSQLQWRGNSNTEELMFNKIIDGQVKGVIKGLESEQYRILPLSIYAGSPDGLYSITPRYERFIHCRPGYDYQIFKTDEWADPIVEKDGLYRINLETNEVKHVVSVRELAEKFWHPTMEGQKQYVEHAMYSPDSEKFAFYHRWKIKDGGVHTRLFICDSDGRNLHMVTDSGMYSHFNWYDSSTLVATALASKSIGSLRYGRGVLSSLIRTTAVPLVRQIRKRFGKKIGKNLSPRINYFLCKQVEADSRQLKFAELSEDGHPSVSPINSRYIVTDTYPNEFGWQSLFLIDLQEKEVMRLAELSCPLTSATTGYRCDLHPRWDRTGKRLIVDSLLSGRRQIYVLNLSRVISPLST